MKKEIVFSINHGERYDGYTEMIRQEEDLMEIDTDKIDDAVLALLYLTLHDDWRAWKGFDWDALNRLHAQGYIENPRNRNKSVEFTEEGLARSELLFGELFIRKNST